MKNPVVLWENETYIAYVKSPSSDPANLIALNTMKTSWVDKTGWEAATFGGSMSAYSWSSNGSSWESNTHRDTPFRFIMKYKGADSFVSGVLDAEQVADWKYIEWEETRPPGTSVNVYVRAGNSPNLAGTWIGPFENGAENLESWLPNSRYIQYMIELVPNQDRTAAPAVHEVRIGYRGGFGSVRLRTLAKEYPDQTWTYEGGAVILAQEGKNVMYSKPKNMIVVEQMAGDNLKISVNYSMIKRLVGGAAAQHSITLTRKENMRTVDNRHTDKIDVTFLSDYSQAWEAYFNDVKRELLRNYGASAQVSRGTEENEGSVTLTIYGELGQGDLTNDIYYTETVIPYNISAN
jgi:hypothetical protein